VKLIVNEQYVKTEGHIERLREEAAHDAQASTAFIDAGERWAEAQPWLEIKRVVFYGFAYFNDKTAFHPACKAIGGLPSEVDPQRVFDFIQGVRRVYGRVRE
jgi:hypothetical protein